VSPSRPYQFLARRGAIQRDRFRRGGRPAILWALRLTIAAVASYVVADALSPGTQPLLAPLTALLVVQVTPVSLLASGLDRVVSVVSGVSVAVLFSTVLPLTWWSLGLVIALSIMVGQALRLRSNLIEVAISAMLVLGVGSFGAESAAWQRITETLVGAAVGIAANLLVPPKVATGEAGNAIEDLGSALRRLLERAAEEIVDGSGDRDRLADLADGWLDEARTVTHDIPSVGAALLRAEQSRRLNVRAIGTPDAGPGLRQGLEALEHSAVAVRSMFRAVHDAVNDPGWPEGEVAEDVVQGLAQVFLELASGLAAFGTLVRAESLPEGRDVPGQVADVQAALEGLHEARARMNEMLLVGTEPALSELHTTVLTTVKRLLVELSLDERMRREMRLWRSRRPLVHPRSTSRVGRDDGSGR
jgi:hypothetical protein